MAAQETAEEASFDTLDTREQGALEILSEICERTGLNMRPEPRLRHSVYLDVELVGDDVSATFGRSGSALDALQYLTNLIVSRRIGADTRLILEAGGYRARRAEALKQMALEYAEAVKDRQEEAVFDAMPAHERRIIHNVLTEVDGIRTYSEGDEPERRVVIAPQ